MNVEGVPCPVKEFKGAPNLLEHFDPTPKDGKYTLNGQEATVTSETRIAKGKEGTVHRVEMTTTNGKTALFAAKIALEGELDEIKIVNEHAKVLDCPGVIPMKIGNYKGQTAVFMPLADGNLGKLEGKLNPEQAESVINVIKDILLCMDQHQMYYFDIKPYNVVFHCKDAEHMSLYLADMSSAIPFDNDGKPSYIATYPAPIDAQGGVLQGSMALLGLITVDKESPEETSELAQKINAFQLSLMYLYLINGGEPPTYISSMSDIAEYYTKLFHYILGAKDVIPGGLKNKYMNVLFQMFEGTKAIKTWNIDKVPLLSEL